MSEQPSVTQFDAWKELAARDPAGFERLRRRRIEEVIAQAPEDHRPRLQGLQWRIDQTRRRAANPMAACVALSRMMWDSLLGEEGLLERLQASPRPPRRRATVLEFRGEKGP